MKKISIYIVIVLAVGAGIYYVLKGNKEKNQEQVDIVSKKNPEVIVRTATVKYENVEDTFEVNGYFTANAQTNISAEMSGQLVALYVKEGSYVKSGQIIARLKGDKLDVSVSNAKAALDNAEMTLNRYRTAFKTGGVTALQLDEAKLRLKNAQAQYKAAQLNSGDTVIRSKIGGIVNKKYVEIGNVVSPGTAIVQVVDISSVKLRVEVDETLVGMLSLGDIVRVGASVTDAKLEGRISFIAPASDGALKFPVEITIPNTFNKLKVGMYGTAFFKRDDLHKTLIVPREAFVGSVSQNEVFVVRNSVAHLAKIKSGTNYGDKVQVIDGLEPGDMVVVSGQINLSDGQKVKILDNSNNNNKK
ncbi:MAG: efflux RND transporter periplasmic adaptor subunit [Bergeyella sp.]|nr:efflux RND transporter periplasmic adaptor subunit [Bergeyella sp.]